MNSLTTVPPPDPDTAVVRRLRARAQRQVDRVVRGTEANLRALARRQRNDVRKVERLRRAARAVLRAQLPDRLLGPATAVAARARVDALQQQVERERAAGHTWHDRLHGVVRWTPLVVVLADLAILTDFMSGVFNVDWTDPAGVPLALAIVFAAAVTLVTYGALTLAGVALGRRRETDGAVPWRDLDPTTWAGVVLAVVAALGVAVLMFVRITYDVGLAADAGLLPWVPTFAAAFAVLSVIGNLTVVHVHAVDGSPLVHRTAQLARRVGRRERRSLRLELRAERTTQQVRSRAREAAELRNLCAPEALRHAARVWPGAVDDASAVVPDLRAVTALVDEIEQLADEVLDGMRSPHAPDVEGPEHDGPRGPERSMHAA